MLIDWHAIVAVLSVYVVGVVAPGPNFVAVAHKAASSTRPAALALVGGIVSVNLFWASCAILGVGIVFTAFPWIALVVKVAGAGYLIWFGSRLIVKATAAPAVDPLAASATDTSHRRAYVQGVATNIANPKSIAFFAAVFASATPAHVAWPTFGVMLSVVLVVSSSWYGCVALVLSHPDVAGAYRRGKAWIDRACGGVIIALGVRQLVR
ncbi:LysE family translocator [Burkholderia plantarii]|uniref:Lysine exporter protein LysE n=1 Tax=Burkholderia plantarii TaxID=41899 RepID=A0A0B6RTD9_BURPL|nr:LysE family translocator [Burkholderia plantarii]AJK48617.1 lysine exporter protein LysE [Burkholderia plantarii]ALK32850.1 Lysine exporter protein LYSE/YGGA [Burkholderia plantarii]WLE61916.1 LysE family translocator [Burkholderia plantarii]GLZ20266.1 threonine transporter [Burkholderia plantarii]